MCISVKIFSIFKLMYLKRRVNMAKGDILINLAKIININQLKNDYKLESYNLIDFTIGFDDHIYLLFSKKVDVKLYVVNTKTFKIIFNWSTNTVCDTIFYDYGDLDYNYHYIRPLKNHIMLVWARCRYHSKDNIDKNALILDENGAEVKRHCFGDGINDCITTADGLIITSYFDEGIFGNYGWRDPIGHSGLIVWDTDGNIVWENKKYSIVDCYAINIDSRNRLWFYYYSDFNLVCTDFQSDIVIQPGISGCNAFALSTNQKKILIQGGYHDLSFYQCSLEICNNKIGEKQKVEIMLDDMCLDKYKYHFTGAKLLFFVDDTICAYDFI